MTSRLSLVAVVVSAVVVALMVSPAGAGPASEQLRVGVDRVLAVLADPALKNDAVGRRAQLRKIADEVFDVRETAQRALGRHWQARTPAERDEFVQLFGDLLEQAYLGKIALYGGEKVQFIGESADAEHATVRTRVVPKQGPEIPVDYRMLLRNDRWVVYDVLIEGVSLVANYRTQFNRVILASSYDGLVRTLKEKTAAETAQAASQGAAPR